MIQRIQSIFLLFSSLFLLGLIYFLPVLKGVDNSFVLISTELPIIKIIIFGSSCLSFFAIFQFKKTHIQRLIIAFVNFTIGIALILIVFIYREDKDIALGLWSFLVPFITLKLASFFIKKDERLIRSSDRIR